MYYLYILKSLKDEGYYIGITDSTLDRLKEHNQGKVRSTKSRRPFILKYSENYNTKTEAREREIQLKRNCKIRKELLLKLKFSVK
ncbi:MAG: GIY-YIG nuclease family protein [Patescibacteria group bacterium]|nr:GIY-YIG nuclease family protein [Patescibacteria group bacterium]